VNSTCSRLAKTAVLVAAALVCAASARAAVVNYAFSGHMVDPFGSYSSGTPFGGSISYDDAAVNIGTPNLGRYHDLNFTLTIGSDTVSDSGNGIISIFDNVVTPYPTDLLELASPVGAPLGGLTLSQMLFALQDLTGNALSGIGLPASLSLGDFTPYNASFIELDDFTGRGVVARGSFDTLSVPEPSTIALALTGLLTVLVKFQPRRRVRAGA
jgi:hypothetical protein